MTSTLPSLYEYYTSGEINAGLSVDQPYFTLNNRNITIYSGSLHYFRVPRQYWRDRLRKLRATGLNTVDTYVPWNLHEPESGKYDFGSGGSDLEDFLHIKEFLNTAQEEDLFAIVRPGPYICAEWEFGGLPSWLLREKNIMLRTSQESFMKYVRRYFSVLLPILAMLQFTRGGPILAFQVENEYSSTNLGDREYIRQLRDLMKEHGLEELLITSDGLSNNGINGALPGEIFMTANLGVSPHLEFEMLEKIQPKKPIMIMEHWIGWFSHWSEVKRIIPWRTACFLYETILRRNASVNIYMFHGGTNFGFMNGANMEDWDVYKPAITSYDYDAPLTENGEYTQKYKKIKQLLLEYNPIKIRIPKMPKTSPAVAFSDIDIAGQLPIYEIINNAARRFYSINVFPMEQLSINNESGQSYGYIVYRKRNIRIFSNTVLTIGGYVRDVVMVLVNGVLVSSPLKHVSDLEGFGYWRIKNSNISLSSGDLKNATLDLIVENWGRANFGDLNRFKQHKGLLEGVYLSGVQLTSWQVIPLEFKSAWTNGLKEWKPFDEYTLGPTLYQSFLDVQKPEDTFIDMSKWTKGIVIVNGFVLGRYAKIGPQQTLYLPAAFLRKGLNTIIVFEHFSPSEKIVFSQKHIFGRSMDMNFVSFPQLQKKEQKEYRNNLYWTVGIVIFVMNNVAMVMLYFMFKRRGKL